STPTITMSLARRRRRVSSNSFRWFLYLYHAPTDFYSLSLHDALPIWLLLVCETTPRAVPPARRLAEFGCHRYRRCRCCLRSRWRQQCCPGQHGLYVQQRSSKSPGLPWKDASDGCSVGVRPIAVPYDGHAYSLAASLVRPLPRDDRPEPSWPRLQQCPQLPHCVLQCSEQSDPGTPIIRMIPRESRSFW